MDTSRSRIASNRVRWSCARGFTLIDLIVSIGVVALLIGILLPGLASAHETARRTVCRSNLREIGFGVASFADERGGFLPASVFAGERNGGRGEQAFQEMMSVRLGVNRPQARPETRWDGLGLLHSGEFLLGPKVYYCPSHHGENPFRRFATMWSDDATEEVVSNYHYRGSGPDGNRELFRIEPARVALVTDGMRTIDDFNHKVGSNVLRADLSADWYADLGGQISMLLLAAQSSGRPVDSADVDQSWRGIDNPARNEPR